MTIEVSNMPSDRAFQLAPELPEPRATRADDLAAKSSTPATPKMAFCTKRYGRAQADDDRTEQDEESKVNCHSHRKGCRCKLELGHTGEHEFETEEESVTRVTEFYAKMTAAANDYARRSTDALEPVVRALYPSIPRCIVANMAEHHARPDDSVDSIHRSVENAARHCCTAYDDHVTAWNRNRLNTILAPTIESILDKWRGVRIIGESIPAAETRSPTSTPSRQAKKSGKPSGRGSKSGRANEKKK